LYELLRGLNFSVLANVCMYIHSSAATHWKQRVRTRSKIAPFIS